MKDQFKIAHAHMNALARGVGCFDAIAATINERTGGNLSKGVISKIMSGQLDWSVKHMIALQDAERKYPLKRFFAGDDKPAPVPNECLTTLSGKAAKENGEAVEAALQALNGCSDKRANAIQEIDEGVEASLNLRRRLEAGQ